MKLNDAQIALVAEKLNVQAMDPEDEAARSLAETFGEHTFYLDPLGLSIFEHSPSDAGASLVLVQITEWTDESRTGLKPIEPTVKPVYLNL